MSQLIDQEMMTALRDFPFSRSRDMVSAHQNLNSSHELTMPLSEIVCHPLASTCYD